MDVTVTIGNDGQVQSVTTAIEDRVARGAALLDQAYVNRDVAWWDQVDLDKLDLYSPTDCVIAQTVGRYPEPRPCWCGGAECTAPTTGSYGDGMEVLGLVYGLAMEYGFTTGEEGHTPLRDAWVELILARRASAHEAAVNEAQAQAVRATNGEAPE